MAGYIPRTEEGNCQLISVLVPAVTLVGEFRVEGDPNCASFLVKLGEGVTLSYTFCLILDPLERMLSLNVRRRDRILVLKLRTLSRLLSYLSWIACYLLVLQTYVLYSSPC